MSTAITWRPVDSSNVASIGWPNDALITETQTEWVVSSDEPGVGRRVVHPLLLVQFKNGKTYGYLGVSRQRAVWMATRCKSVGCYVNKTIKPNFRAVRIPELDTTTPPF